MIFKCDSYSIFSDVKNKITVTNDTKLEFGKVIS